MKLSGIKIDTPNDLLALSYIKEVKKLNKDINIINIKRSHYVRYPVLKITKIPIYISIK